MFFVCTNTDLAERQGPRGGTSLRGDRARSATATSVSWRRGARVTACLAACFGAVLDGPKAVPVGVRYPEDGIGYGWGFRLADVSALGRSPDLDGGHGARAESHINPPG